MRLWIVVMCGAAVLSACDSHSIFPSDGGTGGSGGGSAGSGGGSGGGSATIYAAGYAGTLGSYSYAPGYWKDGEWTALPLPGNSSVVSPAGGTTSIALSGHDVYVAGNVSSNDVNIPGYWLDGSWTALTAGSHATALVLSGSDVIVSGDLAATPGDWLNGTWSAFTLPSGSQGGQATSLAVSNSHVYASGFVNANSGLSSASLPGYWLDGSWVGLSTSGGALAASSGAASSIEVIGNDVYVAGSAGTTPVVWTNGALSALPQLSNNYSAANAVVAIGGDVYVAGCSTNASGTITTAGYWLNGSWVGVSSPAGSTLSCATSLAISGADVYAGGYSGGGSYADGVGPSGESLPGYWLNGSWVGLSLDGGTSDLTGAVSALVVQ